jgi:hypothetical protein
MGNTWEVYEWWRDETNGEDYKYHLEYAGQSFIKAVLKMVRLRMNGAKCLKLEWR